MTSTEHRSDDRPARRLKRLKPRRTVIVAVIAAAAAVSTLFVANTSAGFNDRIDTGSWTIGAEIAPQLPPPGTVWGAGVDGQYGNHDQPAGRATGTSDLLRTINTTSHGEVRSVYGFDFSNIPAGASVTSATLRLYVQRNQSRTVNVYRATFAWTESNIANRQGSSYLSGDYDASSTVSFRPGGTGWIEVEVAPIVNAILQAGVNNGMVIRETGRVNVDSNAFVEFRSSEYGNGSYAPQLVDVTFAQ